MKDKRMAKMIKEDEKYFIHNRILRFILILLLGAVLLAAAAAGFRWGYHALKTKRLLSQAREYVEKGDFSQAALAARTAAVISPKNVEAIELLAEMAEKESSPMVLPLRRRLLDLEPTSTPRKLDFARAALANGQPAAAEAVLGDIPEPERNTASYQNMRSAALLQSGNIAGAETAARNAVELSPEDISTEFNLAILLVQKADPSDLDEINRLLRTASEDPSMEVKVKRLLFAVARQSGENDTALQLASELAGSDTSNPQEYLPFLNLLQEMQPGSLGLALDKLLERLGPETETVVPLLSWMLQHGESARVRQWIESLPPERQRDAGLRIARADALAARGDWSTLRTWLSEQGWTFADYIRKAYLARALKEGGESTLANARWREALREASTMPLFLQSLQQVVAGWKGQESWHAEVLWKLYETALDRNALAELHTHYHREKDASGLRRVTSILHRLDPEDAGIRNNHAYLGLLLGLEVPQSETLAKTGYEEAPQDPVRAATWAFALLRRGEAQAAAEVLSKLQPETLQSKSLALVQGLVLADTGKSTEAAERLEKVETERLLGEEEALLKNALSKIRRSAEPSAP